MNDQSNQFHAALAELKEVFTRVDESAVDAACAAIAGAKQVAVFGCGREALQLKGFAMRLFHLGVPVAVVGDITMPALGPGDLLIASSGPGELATVMTMMRLAKDAGAKNLVVTAEAGGSAARFADLTLLIPAQTMASDQGSARSSVLPMGSLFEGSMFVLFEVMVLKLKTLLGVTPEAMRGRHTNME